MHWEEGECASVVDENALIEDKWRSSVTASLVCICNVEEYISNSLQHCTILCTTE